MKRSDTFNFDNSYTKHNLTVNNPNPPIFLKPLFLLTIIIISLSFISAAEINFTKNSSDFNQGETLIAKISGNFLDKPAEDNVFFYRGHVRIPMVYEISEVNNDFYIYALLSGKSQGNYSLSLENVRYMAGLQESEENIVKNFTINQNISDFSVEPGFVINDTGFSIEVQNLQDSQIKITVSTSEHLLSLKEINLNPGETRQIDFGLNNEEKSFSEEIKLASSKTSYSIPVFITSNLTSNGGIDNNVTSNETTGDGQESAQKESFRFEPNVVIVSMSTDSKSKRIVYLMNTGDKALKDITFSITSALKPYVTIISSENIDENSTGRVEIIIESDTEEKLIEGEVTAESENFTSDLKLTLNFISDYVAPEGEQGEEVIVTTCIQLKGNICAEKEECSGETADAKDGVCCLPSASCQVIKKSSTGKIIGWTLVVLVLLLLFWFFKKYKKVKPQIKFPK